MPLPLSVWRHDVSLWVAENVTVRRNTMLGVSTSVQLGGKMVRASTSSTKWLLTKELLSSE